MEFGVMDIEQGLQYFWSQFGVLAFEENSVPEEIWDDDLQKMIPLELPYITYQKVIGEFDENTALTASIYSKSDSWSEADAILNRIYEKVKNGGDFVPVSTGKLWFKSSTPFAQSMGESDKTIRRYILHLAVEFMTA